MATINTDEATKSDLKAYCKKHDITQGDFVKFALGYFSKSGISPTDTPESVKEELAKIEKRVSQQIAFQKTFEKEKLNPLLNNLTEVMARLKQTGGSTPKAGAAPTTPNIEELKRAMIPAFNQIIRIITGQEVHSQEEIARIFNLTKAEAKLDKLIQAMKESNPAFKNAYREG